MGSMAAPASPAAGTAIRQTYEHYSARGMVRPWTAKPQRPQAAAAEAADDGDDSACRVPSLMEMCMDMISNHLHTFPSIDYLPSHLIKDIMDRRKNEAMTDSDLPFFLAATFDAVPQDQLDFLSLRSCSKVTDAGFEYIFRSCPALQVLDLSFSDLVGDKALASLADTCPHLESLNLTGCRQVSDTGCSALARLRELKAIHLELCNKVTDVGIQKIVRAAGTRLQVLNLGDVRHMTNVSVQIIADHCPALVQLSIAGNMQAMDMDVGDICARATLLQALNLRACRRLTDGCLKPIAGLLRCQHRYMSMYVSMYVSIYLSIYLLLLVISQY